MHEGVSAFGLSLTGGGFGPAGFCGEVVDKIGDKKVVRFELEGESGPIPGARSRKKEEASSFLALRPTSERK